MARRRLPHKSSTPATRLKKLARSSTRNQRRLRLSLRAWEDKPEDPGEPSKTSEVWVWLSSLSNHLLKKLRNLHQQNHIHFFLIFFYFPFFSQASPAVSLETSTGNLYGVFYQPIFKKRACSGETSTSGGLGVQSTPRFSSWNQPTHSCGNMPDWEVNLQPSSLFSTT